jgi:hypothetical protein
LNAKLISFFDTLWDIHDHRILVLQTRMNIDSGHMVYNSNLRVHPNRKDQLNFQV